eukprot:gnl/Spiro4/12784_TR6770_c0_g1_i1.p1 gnl/Spiro4/12784_TR6770_c0_g1~~gnl/Spiro4/12784_TR6770_c0_g1_i1.p1  ORF type:complete len:374 (+),score=53.43 gnl/Spiro4/12784_TR6770_c0_g1_i1:31-1122(+)
MGEEGHDGHPVTKGLSGWRAWLVSSLVFAVIMVLFSVVLSVFIQNINTQSIQTLPRLFNYSTIVHGTCVLDMSIPVVDLSTLTATFLISPESLPGPVVASPIVNLPFSIGINGNYQSYAANQYAFSSYSLSVPITGFVARYPFDTFTATVCVSCFEGTVPSSPTTTNMDIAINMNTVAVLGYVYSVMVDSSNSVPGQMLVNVTLARSVFGTVYPVFLILAFWCIGLIALGIGFQLVVFQVIPVHIDHVALVAALIFSLGALRDTAPGSPGQGTLLDYSSYYWCMLICVLVWLGITLLFAIQHALLKKARSQKVVHLPTSSSQSSIVICGKAVEMNECHSPSQYQSPSPRAEERTPVVHRDHDA